MSVSRDLYIHACSQAGIPSRYIDVDVSNWESDKKSAKFVRDYLNNIDNVIAQGLCVVFIGYYNSGKTFLSSCIATKAIKKSKKVCYNTLIFVLNAMEKTRYSKEIASKNDFYLKTTWSNIMVVDMINEETWKAASNWSRSNFVDVVILALNANPNLSLIFNIDTPSDFKTLKESQSYIQKVYGPKFARLIFDNFKPHLLKKYTGHTKKVSDKWKGITDGGA